MNIQKDFLLLPAIADFTVGALIPLNDQVTGAGTFLVLDVFRPALAEFTESLQLLSVTPLPHVAQIDAAMVYNHHLILTDFPNGLIHRWKLSGERGALLDPAAYAPIKLESNSRITALREFNGQILALDKNTCQLRLYDRDWRQIKTVGSRMGYFLESNRQPRLGFEFPEDLLITEKYVIISDSGNKRLVMLNHNLEMEKVTPLPEYPYKFILRRPEALVVSDFDLSLLLVSPEFGYINSRELDFPADFSPAVCRDGLGWLGVEAGNQLIRISIPELNLEQEALEGKNDELTLRLLMASGRIAEARTTALETPPLLPLYATLSADSSVDEPLASFLQTFCQTEIRELETLSAEIRSGGRSFLACYKAVPGNADMEAAQIARENVRFRLFQSLKAFRGHLQQLERGQKIPSSCEKTISTLRAIMDDYFQSVRQNAAAASAQLEKILGNFSENAMLEVIIDYWLHAEIHSVLFPLRGHDYRKWFGNRFLLEILKDFYFNIAELYIQRNDIDHYIRFADLELSLFPDKMGIFRAFVDRLMSFEKYDNILLMLKKFPDQNRENVNLWFSRVYNSRGMKEQAFQHLKKEIDLYSHRTDLIPALLEMKVLSLEQGREYIARILDKSGHSIDTHYHTALAYEMISDYEAAESQVDCELEQFPENRPAILLKARLMARRQPGMMAADYYQRCWKYLGAFIVNNQESQTAQQALGLFAALDHLEATPELAFQARSLLNLTKIVAYRRELLIYLSFAAHCLGITEAKVDIDRESHKEPGAPGDDIAQADADTGAPLYLTAFSTAHKARRWFFERAILYRSQGRYHDMFNELETILKYYPGDAEIFSFLEQLASAGEVS